MAASTATTVDSREADANSTIDPDRKAKEDFQGVMKRAAKASPPKPEEAVTPITQATTNTERPVTSATGGDRIPKADASTTERKVTQGDTVWGYFEQDGAGKSWEAYKGAFTAANGGRSVDRGLWTGESVRVPRSQEQAPAIETAVTRPAGASEGASEGANSAASAGVGAAPVDDPSVLVARTQLKYSEKSNVREAGGKYVLFKWEGGQSKGVGGVTSVKQTNEVRETKLEGLVNVDLAAGRQSSDPVIRALSDAAGALGVNGIELAASGGLKQASGIDETKWEKGQGPKQKTTQAETVFFLKGGFSLKADVGDLGVDAAKVEWKPEKGAVEVSTGGKVESDTRRFVPAGGTIGEEDGDGLISARVAGTQLKTAGVTSLAPNAVDDQGKIDRPMAFGHVTGNVGHGIVDGVTGIPGAAIEGFLWAGEALAGATDAAADQVIGAGVGVFAGGDARDAYLESAEAESAEASSGVVTAQNFFAGTANGVSNVNRAILNQVYDKLSWQIDGAQYAMVLDARGKTAKERVDEAVTARFAPRLAALEASQTSLSPEARQELANDIRAATYDEMRKIDGGEYARLADKLERS